MADKNDKNPPATSATPAAPAAAPTIEAKAPESPAPVAAAPAKAAPATFAELKAAFGGKAGGDAHIVECLDKGHTMIDAVLGWSSKLEAQLATAKTPPAAEPKAPETKGPAAVQPVATFTEGAPGAAAAPQGEPTTFAQAVAKVLKDDAADFKGKKKDQAEAVATARAAKKYPQLHAAWRAENFAPLKLAQ